MTHLISRYLLIVFSILLIARLVPGVSVDGLTTTLIVALVLGLINITLKPILFVLTLPVTILTLGLFAFILNALLLWFVASFVEGFYIDGFIPALLSALIISLVTWVGNKVLP